MLQLQQKCSHRSCDVGGANPWDLIATIFIAAVHSLRLNVSFRFFQDLKFPNPCIMLICWILCGSKEDVEKWHAVYCQKLTELFDNYKGRNPDYKHKKLIIKWWQKPIAGLPDCQQSGRWRTVPCIDWLDRLNRELENAGCCGCGCCAWTINHQWPAV